MTVSALYAGHVMHQRVRPRRHRLHYRLFMLLLDLDEIDALSNKLRLFARGKRALLTFRDRDYGAGTKEPLRSQIERHLMAADIPINGGPIRLLTMPRIFGFVFNPLSVYFCYRLDGTLAATLYEVNNTFGERHSYLLPVDNEAGDPICQSIPKSFHVSPFMGMDMDYAFRVTPPGEELQIAITASDGDGPMLTAVLTANRKPLTDANLLRAFAAYPFVTFKVVGGILWEALKLWVKGVPVTRRPMPPRNAITSPALAAANLADTTNGQRITETEDA